MNEEALVVAPVEEHARTSKMTCEASDHTNMPHKQEKPFLGHSGAK